MHLYLSDRSPLHATFATEEGQAIYKVDTPFKFPRRTATISRIIPNGVEGGGAPDEPDMQDRYGHLAEIEFGLVSSRLRFGGSEIETKDYFRKGSSGAVSQSGCSSCSPKLISQNRIYLGIAYSQDQMVESTSGKWGSLCQRCARSCNDNCLNRC